MADKKNDLNSNTTEINSIINEAKTRAYVRPDEEVRPEGTKTVVRRAARKFAVTPPEYRDPNAAPVYKAYSDKAVTQAPAPTPAPADNDTGDDYVFINENGSYDLPGGMPAAPAPAKGSKQKAKTGKKKKKGPLIAVLVILGVLLLGGGCFTWYMLSGSSTFASNITVSGVSIAGMDTEEAKKALASVENRLADEIRIEVSAGDKKITLTKDDFKYSFNTDELLSDAKEYSEQKGFKSGDRTYDIAISFDDNSYKDAVKKVTSELSVDPKDAEVTDFNADKEDMFTFADEVSGFKVDDTKIEKQLKDFLTGGKRSGSITAAGDELKPKYTAAYLKKNIKLLGSYSTYSTNNDNGNENMRVSLKACNNSIIKPGETWSFNDHTGDSNLESNGYKPAGVITQGRYETGIGGGICQSSTTIYNAALFSGMEIVERYCHYYPSSYVDLGRDATIDYGNLDLKLKNPYDTPVFLKCYMDGVELYAEIYGLESGEYDEIKITSSDPSYFSNGYKVTTTRTYYKNGKVVKTEELPSSTYYTSPPDDGSTKKKPTTSNDSPATSAPVSDPEPTSAPEPEPVTTAPEEPVTPDPEPEPATTAPEEPVTPDPEPISADTEGPASPDPETP